MDETTVKDCWMTIGTDNKKAFSVSSSGRVKTGEKGIGRFALNRLGSVSRMITKKDGFEHPLIWDVDWSDFEKKGEISSISADLEESPTDLSSFLPPEILSEVLLITKKSSYTKGTILIISKLRERFSKDEIDSMQNSLSALLPPQNQEDFSILIQKDPSEKVIKVSHVTEEDFDYRLTANFENGMIEVKLERNEFDLSRFPNEVFSRTAFKNSPYTREDFLNKGFSKSYPLSFFLKGAEKEDLSKRCRDLGPFMFEFIFNNLGQSKKDYEQYFYKPASLNRDEWMETNAGIKIYRDKFKIRSYGDADSDKFDWLGLDARHNSSPASIGHESESWKVRNIQCVGSLFITRSANKFLEDQSGREAFIKEGAIFPDLKKILLTLISIVEKDRAHICRDLHAYYKERNTFDFTKKEGMGLATSILEKIGNDTVKESIEKKVAAFVNAENVVVLAKSISFLSQDQEDMFEELKLVRALATNGLITTSFLHDLKVIRDSLADRIDLLVDSHNEGNNEDFIRLAQAAKKNDIFMVSWIDIATNLKKNKRELHTRELYSVISGIVDDMKPLADKKNVKIIFTDDGKNPSLKIYEIDFQSIFYNLIIDSIESFAKNSRETREINISATTNDSGLTIEYSDNGFGIDEANDGVSHADIFDYGVTSKENGTGLGLYIVKTTLEEYLGTITLTKYIDSFAVEIFIPIPKKEK
jgi:hypothetical protein